MEKHVKITSSMKFKVMALLLFGIVVIDIVCMAVAIPSMRKNMRSLTQGYMLDEAEAYGDILDAANEDGQMDVLSNAAFLEKTLSQVKISGMDSSYAYLVAADGTMLYHPTTEKIGQPVENVVVSGIVEDLKNGIIDEPTCVEYDFKGVTKYASYYIGNGGSFVLVVTADESEAFAAITSMTVKMVIASLAAIVVLMTIGVIAAERTIAPLGRLTGIVNKVAMLDFTENEGSLMERFDEILRYLQTVAKYESGRLR